MSPWCYLFLERFVYLQWFSLAKNKTHSTFHINRIHIRDGKFVFDIVNQLIVKPGETMFFDNRFNWWVVLEAKKWKILGKMYLKLSNIGEKMAPCQNNGAIVQLFLTEIFQLPNVENVGKYWLLTVAYSLHIKATGTIPWTQLFLKLMCCGMCGMKCSLTVVYFDISDKNLFFCFSPTIFGFYP